MLKPSYNLKNHFLIAMPQMLDPNFSGTLIYICEHDENGTLGLVVNRPSELTLKDVAEQLNMPSPTPDHAIFTGGPVEPERGFILHPTNEQWPSAISISDQISLSTSKDILSAIASGKGPEKSLIVLGYAGWGGGQLEEELSENAWLSCQASPEILFESQTTDRVKLAMASLGIETNQLSSQIGHA